MSDKPIGGKYPKVVSLTVLIKGFALASDKPIRGFAFFSPSS